MSDLNSIKYLYLKELSEPRDNSLRLILAEAVLDSDGVSNSHPEIPELSKILTQAIPIQTTAACRVFELKWKQYAAYLVTEELVGSCGKYDDELFTGTVFRTYSKSHFLDHLARDTGGHTAELVHYKLICLSHLIDVAAYEPPELMQVTTVPDRIH